MQKIEKVFAFITEEDKIGESGTEGIVAIQGEDKWMPLIGADMDRVESLMLPAQAIANTTGMKITILEFSTRKTIGVLFPKGGKHGPKT